VIVIVFLTSFIATLLSSMSGVGVGIIAVPIFLWLGLSFPAIEAMGNINSVFWVIPASWNYLRGKEKNWVLILLFSFIGLVGAYGGALVVMHTPEKLVNILVGLLILLVIGIFTLRPSMGVQKTGPTSLLRRGVAYLFSPILGFYEVFFGVGNGLLFSLLMIETRGFDLVTALGHYYAISFLWALIGGFLLLHSGFGEIPLVVASVIGTVVGGYVGSRYARNMGNRFIRRMVITIGILFALRLLFFS